MSRQDEISRTVNSSLKTLTRLVESDTEVSIIDLNLLENLNTNQSLNYIKLEEKMSNLERNSALVSELDHDVKKQVEKLNKLEESVDNLEALTKELDEWTKELEMKTKFGPK